MSSSIQYADQQYVIVFPISYPQANMHIRRPNGTVVSINPLIVPPNINNHSPPCFWTPQFRICEKYCTVRFENVSISYSPAPIGENYWGKVSVYLDSNKIPASPLSFCFEACNKWEVYRDISCKVSEYKYQLVDDKISIDLSLKKDLKSIPDGVIVLERVPFAASLTFVELHIRCQKSRSSEDIQTYLGEPLLSLLHERSYCDFVLFVKGQEIPAHRLLLAAYSPVFKNMFDSDMLEKKTRRVEIEDLEPIGVKAMIEYMYSLGDENYMFQSCSIAIEMFKCAHKYQVEVLKENCSRYLQKALDETNALDLLQLSCIYSDTHLREEALQFTKSHPSCAADSQKCLSVISTCPELFQFLLQTDRSKNQ